MTKDQRYYRKNRVRRLAEKSAWQKKNRPLCSLYVSYHRHGVIALINYLQRGF